MWIRKRLYQRLLPLAVLMGLLFSFCPLQAATNQKLSGFMPFWGGVVDFQISPDGRHVVYRADQDTDQVLELYSVLLGGGPPIRLNPLLVTGQSVEDYQISPDGRWVVYRADQDTDNTIELYSVPIEGPMTAGIRLNGPLAPNGNVASFQISPDSSRVVYRADQEADGLAELFSVPISGPAGPVIKLNGSLVSGGDVFAYQISPDGGRVVYRADQDTDNVFELYSVPLVGGTPGIKLNSNLVSGGDVSIFRISPDGNRVVYGADQDAFTRLELYSVSINGPTGSAIKLNGPLVANGEVSDFQISPDSRRVVYRADQDTDEVMEIFSVSILGPTGSGIKLHAQGPNSDVDLFQISSDSRRVVYRADQDTDQVSEIFSVPIEGGTPGIKLNGLLLADEVVSFS